MATKKSSPASSETAAPKINPFAKIKKASDTKAGGLDHVKAPEDLAPAVDKFKKIQAQIKGLEGDLGEVKGRIESFGRMTFAQRQMRNQSGNFYIDGAEDSVSYQFQNASSAIADEDYQRFVSEKGEHVAQALLKVNTASIKFNSKTLEEPGVMDKVVDALQALPADILDRLFTPASYDVVDDVFVKARAFAKTPEEYAEIMARLKVRNYVKG